ncbi:MAG: hypothetical protein ABH830_00685 [Patescibacteria group bacterium]
MDINFLPKDTRRKKRRKKEKNFVIWSKPKNISKPNKVVVELKEEKKVLPKNEEKKGINKIYNIFKKGKQIDLIDRKKIKASRKEVLKTIREEKKLGIKLKPKPEVKKESIKIKLPKDKKGLLSRLKSLFNIRANRKKIIKDKIEEEKEKTEKKIIYPRIQPEKILEKKEEIKIEPEKKEVEIKEAKEEKEIIKTEKSPKFQPEEIKEEKVRKAEKISFKKPNKELGLAHNKWIKFFKKFFSKEKEKKEAIVKNTETKGEWQASEILETNLIKGELYRFFDWQKNIIILCLFIFLSFVLLGSTYFGFIYWGEKRKQEVKEIADKINLVDEEIARAEKEISGVLIFKERLALVKILLDGHIYWTNFFDLLEDNILEDVYLKDFSGDYKGVYSIPAVAKNLYLIELQVKKFLQSEYVIDASVSGAEVTYNEDNVTGNVNFQIDLTVDPLLFTK